MDKNMEQRLANLEGKMELILDEVKYIKDKLDSLIWRVITIGCVSGALGTVAALLIKSPSATTALETFFK